MYLSRSLSIKLAFSIIGIFIAATIVAVTMQRDKNSSRASKRSESVPAAGDTGNSSDPQAANKLETDDPNLFVIKNFKRSESKEGVIAWEIEADKGSMIPGDTKARIDNARLRFYRKNGPTLELTAPVGDLILSAASVEKANLSGGVTFSYQNGYTVKTEQAVFEKATNVVTSQTPTTITNSDFEIIGNNLHFDGSTKILNLTEGVKTTIFAKP